MILKRKLYSTKLARATVGVGKKVLGKTPMQAKRMGAKVQGFQKKASDLRYKAVISPGSVMDDAIGATFKNPMTAAAAASGPLVPAPAVFPIEQVVKEKVKPYKWATDGLHSLYKKSRIGDKVIRPVVDGLNAYPLVQ